MRYPEKGSLHDTCSDPRAAAESQFTLPIREDIQRAELRQHARSLAKLAATLEQAEDLRLIISPLLSRKQEEDNIRKPKVWVG